jgi:hypothetical protein
MRFIASLSSPPRKLEKARIIIDRIGLFEHTADRFIAVYSIHPNQTVIEWD